MAWQTVLSFVVVGKPVGQPRPRVALRGRRYGVFDPGTAAPWRLAVTRAARNAYCETPIVGPIKVFADFFFPVPRGVKAALWQRKKPDIDNVLKSTLDALTAAGLWKDDAEVSEITAMKHYAPQGREPGADIEVCTWRD
jgi:Holliday junction resolvase RusA-like endonuclease